MRVAASTLPPWIAQAVPPNPFFYLEVSCDGEHKIDTYVSVVHKRIRAFRCRIQTQILDAITGTRHKGLYIYDEELTPNTMPPDLLAHFQTAAALRGACRNLLLSSLFSPEALPFVWPRLDAVVDLFATRGVFKETAAYQTVWLLAREALPLTSSDSDLNQNLRHIMAMQSEFSKYLCFLSERCFYLASNMPAWALVSVENIVRRNISVPFALVWLVWWMQSNHEHVYTQGADVTVPANSTDCSGSSRVVLTRELLVAPLCTLAALIKRSHTLERLTIAGPRFDGTDPPIVVQLHRYLDPSDDKTPTVFDTIGSFVKKNKNVLDAEMGRRAARFVVGQREPAPAPAPTAAAAPAAAAETGPGADQAVSAGDARLRA